MIPVARQSVSKMRSRMRVALEFGKSESRMKFIVRFQAIMSSVEAENAYPLFGRLGQLLVKRACQGHVLRYVVLPALDAMHALRLVRFVAHGSKVKLWVAFIYSDEHLRKSPAGTPPLHTLRADP